MPGAKNGLISLCGGYSFFDEFSAWIFDGIWPVSFNGVNTTFPGSIHMVNNNLAQADLCAYNKNQDGCGPHLQVVSSITKYLVEQFQEVNPGDKKRLKILEFFGSKSAANDAENLIFGIF